MKRYYILAHDMTESIDGDWVKAEDVQSLESENASLREALEFLVREVAIEYGQDNPFIGDLGNRAYELANKALSTEAKGNE